MTVTDGAWDLVSYDPHLKRSTWRYFDGERSHYRTTYDADAILDANAAERASNAGQRWGEWRKIASVPLNVYNDALLTPLAEGDNAHVRRWLNDSHNAAFRTKEGRV